MANTTADELAIRALVARYADAVNRRDADAWAANWAEDGVWEVFGNAIEGREAVAAAWKGAMAGFPLVFHQVYSGVVEIQGGAGTGRFATAEWLRPSEGPALRMLGLYHDVYLREASGWRFQRRRLEVMYQGPTDLSGPF